MEASVQQRGDLPAPGTSKQQTGCLVLDIDKNGLNDIVITSREAGAGMVWYRRGKLGWTIYPIDRGLNIEAGGASADIDGDGDLDLVFGEDYTGSKLYWWENPYPHYSPNESLGQTRDQERGWDHAPRPDLRRLRGRRNQSARFLGAEIEGPVSGESPARSQAGWPWPVVPIARVGSGEGLAKADIDGDGKIDLIGGGYWFKHQGGMEYQAMLIDKKSLSSRAAAGQIVEGCRARGSLRRRETVSDASSGSNGAAATGSDHDLLGEDVVHGHSLELADIDQDGHLDIFCAEMAQWTDGDRLRTEPGARMWIFYGDGHGRFAKTLIATGIDNHESRVSDLDGDGDLDIVVKPYTRDTPRLDIWLNQGTGPRKKVCSSD